MILSSVPVERPAQELRVMSRLQALDPKNTALRCGENAAESGLLFSAFVNNRGPEKYK